MTTALPHSFITVVSGLPRSGTSLMMQMLHAGGLEAVTDSLRAADDDNPRGYLEFEKVKQLKTDKSWLPDADGKVVKVIHLLLMNLPDDREYRVLFMHRDLDEVVRSQQAMLKRAGKAGGGLEPQRLKQVYENQLIATRRWLDQRPRFKVLEVSYIDLINSPASASARVNAFLGGGLKELEMVKAVDPSLYRNRTG